MTNPLTVDQRRSNFVRWMADNDLTVGKVATVAKVPATTLYTFVQGRTQSMSGQTQDKIAHAYGVSVGDIFGRSLTRRLSVSGSFTYDGELRPFAGGDKKIPTPSWLASGPSFVVCRVGAMPMTAAGPACLMLFRGSKSKVEASMNTWALVELDDDRRLFRRLRVSRDEGVIELERPDGAHEVGHTVVAAWAMLGTVIVAGAEASLETERA